MGQVCDFHTAIARKDKKAFSNADDEQSCVYSILPEDKLVEALNASTTMEEYFLYPCGKTAYRLFRRKRR